MIIEQSFFRLCIELAVLPISTISRESGRQLYEDTLRGIFYSCLVKELESFDVHSACIKVLPNQCYERTRQVHLTSDFEKIKRILPKCDLKVDISDLRGIEQMTGYGCRKVNWIEIKLGKIPRHQIQADIIRLVGYVAKNEGKYLLFVSDTPASQSLQATRKHSWVHSIFEESGHFRNVDILEKETERNRNLISNEAPLRQDDSFCKISGHCFSFTPLALIKKKYKILRVWYGYLVKIDDGFFG